MAEYIVSLSRFEGPMDLLIHLVSRAKVDIKDIFISQITEQYLDFMAQTKDIDMDSASRFLEMAAYLINIKSRILLPSLAQGEPDPVAEQKNLIRLLEEYSAIKAASMPLSQGEDVGIERLYRLPEEMPEQETLNAQSLSVDKLFAAMVSLMLKKHIDSPPLSLRQLNREGVSVESYLKTLRQRLRGGKRFGFDSLFSEEASRGEVIAAFLAVLELMHLGEIQIEQAEPFSPIEIRPVKIFE
jgi:segregation and condensation protein A